MNMKYINHLRNLEMGRRGNVWETNRVFLEQIIKFYYTPAAQFTKTKYCVLSPRIIPSLFNLEVISTIPFFLLRCTNPIFRYFG